MYQNPIFARGVGETAAFKVAFPETNDHPSERTYFHKSAVNPSKIGNVIKYYTINLIRFLSHFYENKLPVVHSTWVSPPYIHKVSFVIQWALPDLGGGQDS